MKRWLSLLLCSVTLLTFAGADEKKEEKKEEPAKAEAKKDPTDQDRIQGKWKVESCQKNGKSEMDRVGDVDTFAGDKLTMESPKLDKAIEAKFKLDPARKPAEIDIVFSVENSGLNFGGIYKLDGDTLTTCWTQPQAGKGRPTDFNSKEGDGKIVFVCKRVKEETKK